ncbi:membrane bound O-acyl transferase family domain-containing protein [Trichoderma aethiopicum]
MALWVVLAYQALLVGIVGLVVGFTSSNSFIRPLVLPLMAALVSHALILNKEAISHKGTWTLINMNTAGLFLQYVDMGLISRWSYSAYGPTSPNGNQPNANISSSERKKPQKKSSGLVSRLKWAFDVATSWRSPATPWEVKGTPHFTEVPSRGRFIARKTITLVWSLLVLDSMSLMGGQPDPAVNAIKFSWDRVRFLTRPTEITRNEVILRGIVVYIRWVAIYYYVQAFYCSLAIVCVAAGISPVQRWPPLFGSISEMYTIRNTWGVFWHQAIRQKISSPAYYTTYSLLGFRKGGIVGRYLFILLTFTVSGLFHLFGEEYPDGIRWDQSGTLRFYSIQALGFMLEDAIQAVWSRVFHCRYNRWTRATGYVWVLFWVFWTSPAYFYPLQLTVTEKKAILPFSVVGPLLQSPREG